MKIPKVKSPPTLIHDTFTVGVIICNPDMLPEKDPDTAIQQIIGNSGIQRHLYVVRDMAEAKKAAQHLVAMRWIHVIFCVDVDTEVTELLGKKNGHQARWQMPKPKKPKESVRERKPEHVPHDSMGISIRRNKDNLINHRPKYSHVLYIPPETEEVVAKLQKFFGIIAK